MPTGTQVPASLPEAAPPPAYAESVAASGSVAVPALPAMAAPAPFDPNDPRPPALPPPDGLTDGTIPAASNHIARAGSNLAAADAAAGEKRTREQVMAQQQQQFLRPIQFDYGQPQRRKRRRRTRYVEPTEPLPIGIPFRAEDYPELSIDAAEDHSKLAHSFKEPLFTKDPSAALSIAYSHRDAAAEERRRIRRKKKATLSELQEIRREFNAKKAELLGVNEKLKASTRKVGGWTRKVFDLELKEPNAWNDKLRNLQEYVKREGQVPEHVLKTKGNDEERSLAGFIAAARSKVKRGHSSMVRHPHRMEALEKLGVHWESKNDARFEIMFAKLLDYRREHGTFRMPSVDLCKESGDKELIALHNWVFSQVGSFRYQLKSKKVETVKRFIDIGFTFERWYATNGHVFDREIPPFDSIIRRYVENGGVMDEDDVEILRKATEKSPRRGTGKGGAKRKQGAGVKRKRKGEEEEKAAAAEVLKANSEAEVNKEKEADAKASEEGQSSPTKTDGEKVPTPMEGVEATDTAVAVETNETADAAVDVATVPANDAAPAAVEQQAVAEAPAAAPPTATDGAVPVEETAPTKVENSAVEGGAMGGEAVPAGEEAAAPVPAAGGDEGLAAMNVDEETATEV